MESMAVSKTSDFGSSPNGPKAWRSPKPQISVQVRTDLLQLFSVIGNTSGFDPEVVGSNPAGAAHGLLV